MNLDLLIITTHQIFFVLVLAVFSYFFFEDRKEILESNNSDSRKMTALFVATITIGTFGTLLYHWGLDGIFFCIAFSGLVGLSVVRPKYAVGFLVFLMISRPWETYANQMMESMPRDISYLVLASLIGHKIIKREFHFRFNLGTIALIFFAAWMFLSAAASNHRADAVFEWGNTLSKGIILFLLIQNGIEKAKDLMPIKAAMGLAILEKAFVSFYKTYLVAKPVIIDEDMERLTSVGILSNSNDIAAIMILAIPFVLFFLIRSRIKPYNWILSGAALIAFAILIYESQSRGALLSFAAMVGAYLYGRINNKNLRYFTTIMAIVAAFGVIGTLSRKAADLEGSTSNRIIFWKAGANMAVRNPVLGVGFWGFNRNFSSYAIDGDLGSEGKHMTAHSSWVLAVAEGGFPALFFLMVLWIYAIWAAYQIRKEEPEYFMALAGYGMACSFLSHTYLIFPYILLASAITHYQIIREARSKKEFEKEVGVIVDQAGRVVA